MTQAYAENLEEQMHCEAWRKLSEQLSELATLEAKGRPTEGSSAAHHYS